ncbi:hypothetical protein BRADI_4g40327v3 [Brachypodium distachyon]|uniref:Uncharacterized protein n=1 Tax=Brachypodium distachyon TaxID=15368 RepID=A0A2K2CTG1_BRADI|nr:hypothetical protein BRADI_4g40327v3 [Brachypodium distachyon]
MVNPASRRVHGGADEDDGGGLLPSEGPLPDNMGDLHLPDPRGNLVVADPMREIEGKSKASPPPRTTGDATSAQPASTPSRQAASPTPRTTPSVTSAQATTTPSYQAASPSTRPAATAISPSVQDSSTSSSKASLSLSRRGRSSSLMQAASPPSGTTSAAAMTSAHSAASPHLQAAPTSPPPLPGPLQERSEAVLVQEVQEEDLQLRVRAQEDDGVHEQIQVAEEANRIPKAIQDKDPVGYDIFP